MQRITYARARTPRDAVLALADGGPGTRLIAGGTTLYDLMKLNVERPTALVDVSRLSELEAFDTSGPGELVFGAMARMSDVAADARLVREYPALSESLWRAASEQLRNMATVGGNLLQRTRCAYFRFGEPFACNKREPGSGCAAIAGLDRAHAVLGTSASCIAVYPGDWAVALVAFDAQIDTISPRGERTIAVEALHPEPGATPHIETVLEHDEMIVRIRVRTTAVGRGSIYHKIRDRESYAFALASAAAAVHLADDGTLDDVRIALGGVATRPWRARDGEQAIVAGPLSDETARVAGQAAFAGARPGHDNAFKIELGVRTVADALMMAKGRARAS